MSTTPSEIGGSSSSKALLKRFIDTYKDMPELWDLQNPNYMRKDKRHAGYEKLLDIFKFMKKDATVDDVKRKLNTLRSNFRRELKKIHDSKRSGVSAEDVYEPSSWVFYELLFLKDLEKPTKNRSTLEAAPEGGDEEGCSTGRTTRPLEVLTSPQPPKKIRILRTSEHVSDPGSWSDPLATKRPESSEVSYENFGRYVATRLEDIEKKSPETCCVVRKLINDAIFEGEMGTLRNISRIVTPSDGHFIMQIPAPLQCPVVAPEKGQCPVTAPEIVQCHVTAPEIIQRHETAPEIVQRPVTVLEKVQRPVTAPEKVQRPVTAPEKAHRPVTAPGKAQSPAVIPEKVGSRTSSSEPT